MKVRFALVVCFVALCGVFGFFAVMEDRNARLHQDVACWNDTGVMALIADDVEVRQTAKKFTVIWPDGKQRVFLTGSCEWDDHDPDRQYDDVQSWQGEPEYDGVRLAKASIREGEAT